MVSASTLTMKSPRCSTASKSSTSTSSSSASRRATPAPVCHTSAAIGAPDDAAIAPSIHLSLTTVIFAS
eukprot:4275189-Prymnesium_polylepis.1